MMRLPLCFTSTATLTWPRRGSAMPNSCRSTTLMGGHAALIAPAFSWRLHGLGSWIASGGSNRDDGGLMVAPSGGTAKWLLQAGGGSCSVVLTPKRSADVPVEHSGLKCTPLGKDSPLAMA